MAWPSDLVRTKNWGTEILTDADLEGQFDLIIAWLMAAFNSSTGHDHSGSSNKGPKIPFGSLTIASQAQGDIIYYNGTAWTRLAAGTSGRFLKTQGAGANPTWADLGVLDKVVQYVVTTDATQSGLTPTTGFPQDGTKPTWAEGSAVAGLNTSITPTNASNKILVIAVINGSRNAGNGGFLSGAVWVNGNGTDECKVAVHSEVADDSISLRSCTQLIIPYYFTAGGTSEITFNYRLSGSSTSQIDYNASSFSSTLYGGAMISFVIALELAV